MDLDLSNMSSFYFPTKLRDKPVYSLVFRSRLANTLDSRFKPVDKFVWLIFVHSFVFSSPIPVECGSFLKPDSVTTR